MTTESTDKNSPRIILSLELAASIARKLDPESLQSDMTQELGEVLEVLGIPGEPLVHIADFQDSNKGAERLLAVSVNGQPCTFADEWIHRAYMYVAEEHSGGTPPSVPLLELLREVSPEQVALFVRFSCREIISRQPHVLLTVDSVAAYRAALADGSDESLLPDAHSLQSLLSTVLNLRISIADRATAAQILKEGVAQEKPLVSVSEDLIAALRPKAIEVQLPSAYLKQITLNTAESELGIFAMMRDGLFYELGVRYPAIRFLLTEDLEPESFRFRINHLTTLPTRGLLADEWLVNDEPDRLGLLRIQGRANINPVNLSICSTIRVEDKDLAEEAGLTTWNQIGFLILAMSAELRTYAACSLDREGVEIYLSDLELTFPQLIEAVRTSISLDLITLTMRLLLAEQTSIRNLRDILQSMIDFNFDDSKYIILDPRLAGRHRPSDEWLNDPVNFASFARIRLKQHISHKYTRSEDTLVGYLLDPEIEALLANDQMMELEAYLAQLEQRNRDRVLAAVRAEVGSLPPSATTPPVFTTSNVRPIFRELTALEFPQLAVLSYQELAPDMNIQPIGRISWN